VNNFNYTTDKNNLVMLGDHHGNFNCIAEFCKNYSNYCILQVGDGTAIGFNHPLKEASKFRKLNKILHESNNEIIFVRGNHERKSAYTNNWIEEEILLLDDYSIINFKDKKIQCVGGGISVDRSDRIIGRSWWENEEVVYSPEKIEKIDIFVSHISPTNFPLTKASTNDLCKHFHGVEAMFGGDLIGELNHESLLIQNLSDLSGAKVHVFGHLHQDHFYYDSINDKKYYLLGINSFKEINL
jgi:calcineurin-like phosphoesterase family protein